jgi:sortase A
MSPRSNSWLLSVFTAGTIIFLFLSSLADNPSKQNDTAEGDADIAVISGHRSASPVRLMIPHIDIDATIEPVGLTEQGSMSAPNVPDKVGWLDSGPSPGETGNAVLDGHRGWIGHIYAVFDRLHELRPGDEIVVEDASGTSTRFRVASVKTYAPGQDASEVFGPSKTTNLNLITCDGNWDASKQSYSERLVVFAVKTSP